MATKRIKPHPSFGSGWRLNGKTVEKKVEVPLEYVKRDIEAFITQVRTACDGLGDPSIDMDVEYGTYGDRDKDVLTVTGWREATQAEIDKATGEIHKSDENRAAYEAHMVAELKKTRPELFK
ncbi:MAG: hypothetical protein ACOH1Y_18345 [Propionicimonas sp.]